MHVEAFDYEFNAILLLNPRINLYGFKIHFMCEKTMCWCSYCIKLVCTIYVKWKWANFLWLNCFTSSPPYFLLFTNLATFLKYFIKLFHLILIIIQHLIPSKSEKSAKKQITHFHHLPCPFKAYHPHYIKLSKTFENTRIFFPFS